MPEMTRAGQHGPGRPTAMTETAKLHGGRCRHAVQACAVAGPRSGHGQPNHGKAAETVAPHDRNHTPEAIIIIDPAVGRPGRLQRSDDDDAARRRAA